MTQNTNLNVSPYFDDFDEDNNYNKVLFKPGFPVQSRELTTLQSILQGQIEKFGQHFFKEGAMIVPGGVIYDSNYFAVKIDPTFLDFPVSTYTSYLKDNKIEIQGEISGVKATVVNSITAAQSVENVDTLYIKYTSSGSDGLTAKFADGETLITLEDIKFSNTTIPANNPFARAVVAEATPTGSAASISEGVFFIRGYFVKVPADTVLLDQYDNAPTYKVGLQVSENILTASSDNPDLFDNAKGFSNEAAPGADRLQISATLTRKSITDNNDPNFVELLRVEDGLVQKLVTTTDYNIFKEELARRTFDESGDYYVRRFAIDIRETLNDRLGNKGIYSPGQLTQQGNTPSDDLFTLQISSGKAYVRGYEIDKIGSTSFDNDKPRTTKLKENVSVPVTIGNSIQVENLFGSPVVGFNNTYTVELRERRLKDNGQLDTDGAVIGNARVYDFNKKNIAGVGTERFDLRLYDIQTFSVIELGLEITAPESAHVKGVFSGATGHLKSQVGAGLTLTVTDMAGEFQINEPIEIDGLAVGRNITSVSNKDIRDVKSIGTSSGTIFACNVAMQQTTNLIEPGSAFQIGADTGSGSAVTSPSVGDFRNVPVRVNDVVSFTIPGQTLPTFNRVSAVTAGQITLVGVSTVVGVCTGGTVKASNGGALDNVQNLNVTQGFIERGDSSGKVIALPNEVVSSVNLLDSSYIVRKQATVTVPANLRLDYTINDLGDDTLFLEPYNEQNYTLTYADGHKEIILDSQVTISTDLKSLTILGLSKAGTGAILTVTARRSSLSSKVKTVTRCNNLIVERSKNQGSGVGATTFDDGLTWSTQFPFGTRVQDEVISLNVPDVTRVLAIYESNDSSPADLPQLTVSSATDTFSNNVTIGEQMIGAESGAVARVVDVVSGNRLNFVYENDRRFELLETLSLQDSGITANITTIFLGDRNVSNDYELDQGQRTEYADFSRIKRRPGVAEPTRQLRIIFDSIATDEGSGTVESVNSYNSLDYRRDIPYVGSKRASDVIDLRPRVNNYNATSTDSPFTFKSRVFSNSNSETAVTDRTLVVDYSFFLGRIDRLYLTKDGNFVFKKGEPSEFPKLPVGNSEGFEVAILQLSPFMFNATYDCRLKMIPHKRFTMKDIGSLENRIKTLEDYTTLSLLETDTRNLAVKDPNTGLDKFKSGFFVDNFRSHDGANLQGESLFDIDLKKGELRPRSTERNVTLQFETVTTEANRTDADYAWANDFSDVNVTRNGPGLTLNFEEVPYIDQPLATRTENLNPYHIALYAGSIDLSPATDYWIEEVVLETPDIVQFDSVFNGMAELLAVEDRENGGMAASWWNSSDFTWNGDDRVFDTQLTNSTVIGGSSSTSTSSFNRSFIQRTPGQGIRRITDSGTTTTRTRTSTIRDEFTDTAFETGTENVFGLELSSGLEEISLGDRVIGVETIHNCRSRNIHVTGKKLKPNTKYYTFMESVDMNQFAFPKNLPITMIRGAFKTGDIVSSIGLTVIGAPSVQFRVAQSNHETGPYNAPLTTITGRSASYSGTSEFLNVDLADLSNLTRPDRLGYVVKGMVLVNQDGTAEAEVGDIQLISNEKGEIQYSLHIPDPTVAANPKFTTGSSTITITSSPVNSPVLDPGGSSAETEFLSSGYATSYEEQVLAVRTPEIDRRFVESLDAVRLTQDQRFVTRTETDTSRSRTGGVTVGEYFDPLAQSFLITADNVDGTVSDGVYVTGGEVYFKTKDPTIPVTVQIRTMRDGTPTVTVVPFGQVNIDAKDVNISDDGSVPTEFKFPTPVYLQEGYEYALTLVSPTEKYLAFITRMGEEDLALKAVYNKQPYLGSLFKSQNQSTWTPSQLEDLKFKLNKAKFVTNTPVSVSFYNSELPKVNIRRENPITAFAKRQTVGIDTSTVNFVPGNTVSQGTNTGDIFATGGGLKAGLTTALVAPTSGVGLTDGTYNGIGFQSLTGFGISCTANVVVSSGVVDTITVAQGGAGYQVGDLLLMNQLGNSGTGVRVTVGVSTTVNLIVIDNVKNNFTTGAYTYTDSNGSSSVQPAIEFVNDDPIRDGKTMLFSHFNHGMHSSQNKLEVRNVQSDVAPTTLAAALNEGDSTISLADGTAFANFEGAAVGAANTGYLLIDSEIISYKTISGNVITIDSRNFDSATTGSLLSNHTQNSNVFKYECNGVSLLKINKIHNIDPREKTFNSYHVSLSETAQSFDTTKAIGGVGVEISQNMPFEYINPSVNLISPTGTTVSARVKTTTGTSLSGSESSFSNVGYEAVTINKLNRLDSPRIVASQVNETELMGGEKSFEMEMLLSTTDENVSPMVDLDTTNIITTSSLINAPVVDYVSDSRVNIPGEDPHASIYQTKRINLEFISNSIFVQFDAHRMGDANVRVFYRLFRNDESEIGQTYIPFNTDGSPDKFVAANRNENGFSEYKYTAENTPQFNGFDIKIVMSSTDQSEVPRIRNFRAIALRSFDSDEF
tara:strand:+ start:1516 stop:8901 length:7386 start_codon:yes stop_codon:yes gene_type:complete